MKNEEIFDDPELIKSNLAFALFNKLRLCKIDPDYQKLDKYNLLKLFDLIPPSNPIINNSNIIKPVLKGISYTENPTLDDTLFATHTVEILVQITKMNNMELNSYVLEGMRTLLEKIVLYTNSEIEKYRMDGFFSVEVLSIVPSYNPDLSTNTRVIEIQAQSTSSFILPHHIQKQIDLEVKLRKQD